MSHTRALAAGLMVAAALCAPATAHAATAATPPPVAPLDACTQQALSQPLLPFKDSNYYTLAPDGGFATGASGWQLAGGASVVATTQRDGTPGGVLDLPAGSQATSPPVCITADYPSSRLFVRSLSGTQGVYFDVQYLRNGVWTAPKENSQYRGANASWVLSPPLLIQPDKASGWQQVRFTLVSSATTKGSVQVDDFWVDPRAYH
jgi:hypothetical protein